MQFRVRALWSLTAILFLSLLQAPAAVAQTATTGSLAGTVRDTQGGALPGATVTAVPHAHRHKL